jgi:hypothetical protein
MDDSGSKGMFTQKISDHLSVRLYSDCRPNCLETAALQKGLVLLFDDKELIEEGVGFGVPIVKYDDKTFFPGAARVSMKETGSEVTLTKIYKLNTVSLKKFGSATYINDTLYSPLRKTFQTLYLKHKKLTPLFNKIMELREIANVNTEFIEVKPRGEVTVSYQCRLNEIIVHVDFSKIALKQCSEILVLNEQGASFFPSYLDSKGLSLVGQGIGAWDAVLAKKSTLRSVNGKLSFQLQNMEGARLFRGFEHTKKRFSWVGLSYSMHPHNGTFDYSMKLACR